ncbi:MULTISPECIES: hypothetical protein [Aeromonas]|uniref:hypothetical protein n=1 Tax=Aeromonas TaxID=642 RepID=UPI00191DC539|nr:MULTISPECIES: hypothetical protein [Aeromonas]MBL0632994.1 hypothetical protein [Aeromonas veronii]MCX4046921.1 hypothetical protein [Aeromonas veronii]WRT71403.1 hypothetical protein VK677_13735 [Aeromonas dhakensis]
MKKSILILFLISNYSVANNSIQHQKEWFKQDKSTAFINANNINGVLTLRLKKLDNNDAQISLGNIPINNSGLCDNLAKKISINPQKINNKDVPVIGKCLSKNSMEMIPASKDDTSYVLRELAKNEPLFWGEVSFSTAGFTKIKNEMFPNKINSAWKTEIYTDEFTGEKHEITKATIDKNFHVAITCGSGPRGTDYNPIIVFSENKELSSSPNSFDMKEIAWKVDDNKGYRMYYWGQGDGFYGANWGNDGDKRKEHVDTQVQQFKSGNYVLVKIANNKPVRISLIGFTKAYNYVKNACRNTYPKYSEHYKQHVLHPLN